jgi:ATP-dependent protease ClpP protease subunit
MKTIYLSGIVGYEITADAIREQINENSKEKLQVVVNSYGGFVIDAFEIFNLFWTYKGEVEFVINGVAASAMSYIIMSGDKISAFKNSIFMAHKAQAVAFGDADSIRREADIADAMDNVLAEAYVGRLKKNKKEILDAMKNEIWLIGWEALTDAGIIDNVIDSPDELEETEEAVKENIIYMNKEMEKLTDPEIRQSAELKIMQINARMMRDSDRVKTNSMKAAAILKNFEPVKPVENNITMEASMKEQEEIKTNPETVADTKESLQSAQAQGADIQTVINEAVLKERERICAILNKSEIKLSETVSEALDKGWDVGTYRHGQATSAKYSAHSYQNKPRQIRTMSSQKKCSQMRSWK